jgi:hypothetical protein
MLHELKQCKAPDEADWKIFPQAWTPKPFQSGPEQIEMINNLESEIKQSTGEDEYCCVVVDGLLHEAQSRAVELYYNLQSRIIFLFLISSDLKILDQNQANSPDDFEEFRTSHLTAENALAYVRHRLDFYRVANSRLPCSHECPLYPFSEGNITAVLGGQPSDVVSNGHTNVTIRQFNRVLDDAIGLYMDRLQDTFDLSALQPEETDRHLIDLAESYRRTINNE